VVHRGDDIGAIHGLHDNVRRARGLERVTRHAQARRLIIAPAARVLNDPMNDPTGQWIAILPCKPALRRFAW
jgi:hypothetical protein